MKRIIYIIVSLITILAILGCVSAFADYEGDNLTRVSTYPAISQLSSVPDAENDSYIQDVASSTSDGPQQALPPDAAQTDTEDKEANTEYATDNGQGDKEGEKTEVEGESPANPFQTLFNTVREYATEIFCSLTFIGSLILAYAYKKGLIPLLQGGISAISGTVTRIKESAERGEGKTDELSRLLCDRLTSAEVCLDGISDTLDGLKDKLDKINKNEREAKGMKLVMMAQVDMLYSIFMTSSLPQYQKDEVGEKIRQMKEELCANDGE